METITRVIRWRLHKQRDVSVHYETGLSVTLAEFYWDSTTQIEIFYSFKAILLLLSFSTLAVGGKQPGCCFPSGEKHLSSYIRIFFLYYGCLSWYIKPKVNIRRSTTSNLLKRLYSCNSIEKFVISFNNLFPEKRFIVVLKLTSFYVNSLFDNLQNVPNFDMLKSLTWRQRLGE